MARRVYDVVRRLDNLSLVLLDVTVVSVAWLLALMAGFEFRVPAPQDGQLPLLVAIPVAIQVLAHRFAGLYGPVWKYASVEEGLRVGVGMVAGVLVSCIPLGLLELVWNEDLPLLTAPPLAGLLILVGAGGVRFQSRLFALERQRARGDNRPKALIVGAGSAGATLAYELNHTKAGRAVRVVGFLDDDFRLARRSVRGIPVLGTTADLEKVCSEHRIDRILIALPEGGEGTKAIVNRAIATHAQVKVLSLGAESVEGPLLRSVRDLDVTDLLGREHSPVDCDGISEYLEGATVLITGAGGSIGSEIARQVASYRPGRLLLVDRDETLLHDVAVGSLADAEAVMLDIRDEVRVRMLFERCRPDVVFHAAANKHVPILESHPGEAVTTNIIGTWILARTAAEFGCRHFVHISTDKAADPVSIMGASKRVAEQVVFETGRRYDLPFVAVRFGNVLGSRGSVVPTFLRQILDGGPITVTDPAMTRYFMTIPEAVSLVLQSGTMGHRSRILLLDMGEPASIMALARQMIRLAGLRPDEDIPIQIVGLRPGERLHEVLHDEGETVEPTEHPSIAGLRPKVVWRWEDLTASLRELEDVCREGDDASVVLVLEDVLRRCGVACELESAQRLARERTGASVGASDDRATIDLADEALLGAGGFATLARPPKRLALLGGEPMFSPALPFARPAKPSLERVMRKVQPSYDSGRLTNGRLVQELEARAAERLGVPHVVAVSSCTTGLMLTVQAVTENRPGPVVLPSFTFSASAHAVAWNGRQPRFTEVRPSDFLADLTDIEANLDGASAIMLTHVFGTPCNPRVAERIAAEAQLPLIFDAAHGFGATAGGKALGGFGIAEVFSLTPTKVMVAGEGGLIATRDEALAARLRIGRDYANPGDYDTRFVGLNGRMSEFHAAMALESMLLLDECLDRRQAIAARYVDGLVDVPGVHPQFVNPSDTSTYKDFTISIDADRFGLSRDQLRTVLLSEGIDTRCYFDPPVHRQQAYATLPERQLPVTDAVAASVVSLPIYPDLGDEDVDRVVDVIRAACDAAQGLAAPIVAHERATRSSAARLT